MNNSDKYRVVEFICENLPAVNTVNAALHQATESFAETKLDSVIGSMEEMLVILKGTSDCSLSYPIDAVTNQFAADCLARSIKNDIERGGTGD